MKLNIDPSLLLDQSVSTTRDARRLNRENPAELRKVCRQFEAIFIRNLLKSMRDTVPDSGLLEKNIDSEVIEDMMDMETAKKMAQKNELGIAEMLFRQLYRPSPAETTETVNTADSSIPKAP
jgi:flagellar protein FlgJ